MDDNVLVLVEASANAGQLDNLKALLREMFNAIQRDEPGTLNYEWFIGDDGKSVHIYERYADSEACMAHQRASFQKYAERLSACGTVTKITIYGNPSDDLRATFASSTIYMKSLAGYTADARIVSSHILTEVE